MRKALILTAFGATLLGVGIGWWAAPGWRQRQALAGIASDDANQRQDAWRWLNASITNEPVSNADLLVRIDDVVRSRDLSDAAVIDAANALRQHNHWGWDDQPASLIARESKLRLASGNIGDDLLALELLQSCPLDADSDTAWPLFVQLMETGQNSKIRALALKTACGWLGRERTAMLAPVRMPEEDVEADRMRRLAMSWPSAAPPHRDSHGPGTELDLSLDPAEPDGSVCVTVLIAERRLPTDQAIELAESWIRDFNDDRKRAGALLSALLGEHADLLKHAYDAEDVVLVRLAQRMALYALDEPVGAEDPKEFAYRALAAENGDFDADVGLCLLARGDRRVLRELTSQPVGQTSEQYRASVRKRDMLIERFAPHWRAEVGIAVPGADGAIREHFDLLESLRWLTQRRLAFDPAIRVFETP